MIFFRLSLTMLCLWMSVSRAGSQQIESILKEADTWIITDTARIHAYIDSCNKVTDSKLKSSPFWNETYRDLSFLMGIDDLGQPQIDNTGRIYFTMRITGQIEHLFYVDEPLGWPRQLTPNNWAEEGLNIYYYEVHPSGDYVLVGVMKHGSEKHNIWLFNRDGGFRPLLIDPNTGYSNVVFKNKDEFYLMVSTDTSRQLCLYSISSGNLQPVYRDKEWIDISDYENGRLLCTRWFSFSESQLFIFDERSRKIRNITGKGYFAAAAFSGDGRVICISDALSKPEEMTKLVFVDLAGKNRISQFFDPRLEIDNFIAVPRARACLALLNRDGYSEIAAVDLSGTSLICPVNEPGVISEISANDFGEFTYSYNAPNKPNTIYYGRLSLAAKSTVAEVADFGFDFSEVNIETVRYRSRDNTLIPALLYLQKNIRKTADNPALVIYHGGPPDQSRPQFQRNVAFALAKGFILMFPNVRGSTGYGAAFERADNLEGRFRALEDAVAALDFLVSEGYSNPAKIGIWGGSYGGYTVNYISVTAPEKFACAVSEVGVADVDYGNTHGDITFQRGWELEFGPIGSKLTYNLSPIFKADAIQRPIFLTAGFNDPRVFAGDPRRFGFLLSKLGKDVLYFESRTSGHWGTTKQQVIEEFTRAYVFFQDHLMGR